MLTLIPNLPPLDRVLSIYNFTVGLIRVSLYKKNILEQLFDGQGRRLSFSNAVNLSQDRKVHLESSSHHHVD
jgi:hypothetical protein